MAQNIKKITSFLFLLRVFKMSLSVVVLIVSAKYFGVNLDRDIWILASTFLLTTSAAIWGPINETFRTKFIFIREEEGEEKAILKTSSLVGFVIVATTIVCILICYFSKDIAVFMINKNSSKESISLFISLLLLLLPTLFINQLTALGISILNAYNVYYIPEIFGVFSGIFNVLSIVLLASSIGIYSLLISQYVSVIILLFAVLYYIRKKNLYIWRYCFPVKLHSMKPFLLYSLPFFFPYVASQCNILTEKWIASQLGAGNVSSLDYARQFTALLQGVLSSVLTTVMIPMLSKAYIKKEKITFESILNENVQVCFIIASLALPLMLGGAVPLSHFFFERGTISFDSVNQITELMSLYSLSFLGVILYLLFGLSLLASNKAKQYAFWGVIAQIIILILNLSLYPLFSIYIFPFSLGTTHLLSAIIMLFVLKLEHKWKLCVKIIIYIVIIFLLSAVLFVFNDIVKIDNNVIQLFFNILLLLLLFPIILRGFGINIFNYLSIHKSKNKL